MNKSLIVIRLKLLLNPFYIISLFTIPFCIFIFLSNIDIEKENKINVGLVYESNEIKERLNKNIISYAENTVNFINFTSKDEMIDSVKSYRIDCGYFFKDTDNYKKSIEVYETETTTSSKVLNIFISSLAIQERSGELGTEVLKKYINKNDNKKVSDEILENAYKYTVDGPLMKIRYENIYSANVEKNKINLDNIFYGVFASVLIFISILNSALIIREKNSSVYDRIKFGSIRKYYVSYHVSYFLINFLYIVISHLLLSFAYKTSYNTAYLILTDLIFSFCVTQISFFISNIFKTDKYIIGVSIFTFIFSFLFGEFIFKINEIISILDVLKYFSLTYYYICGLSDIKYAVIILIIGISVQFFNLKQFKF